MKLSLTIQESNAYIRQQILENLSIEINNTINRSMPTIQNNTINIINNTLKQEPEYASLKNGKLHYEFGISDSSAVDDIVDKLSKTVNIHNRAIKITNMGLSGGFDVTAIENENFNGLLQDPSAIVQDDVRGYTLPWLEWILLRGNEVIVRSFDVKLGANPNSRTGNAIMIESNRGWRVPSEFAGNNLNNWTTRAIERCENELLKMIQQTIESNI